MSKLLLRVLIVLLLPVFPAHSEPGTGSPQPRLAWAWSANGNAVGARGLEIVDVDGDEQAEIFAVPRWPDYYWYQLRFGSEIEQVWSSLPIVDEIFGLAVAADSGGYKTVVLTSDSILVVDARTKSPIAEFATLSSYNRAIAVADLDGNGILDAVVCDSEDLYRYELLTGTSTAVKYGFGCSALAIGQIDADPQLEIAMAGNVSGGYLLDGISLAVDWGDIRGFGPDVELGDVTGDGLDEVVALAADTGGLRVQSPTSGETLWEVTEQTVDQVEIAEASSTPGLEVAWSTSTFPPAIRVAAGTTGETVRTIAGEVYEFGALAAGDVDGDGKSEILWSESGCCDSPQVLLGVQGEATTWTARSVAFDGWLTGAAVKDFSGTGVAQVATATSGGIYYGQTGSLLMLSLHDGHLDRFQELIPGWDINAITDIAGGQLDADPQYEVCVANYDYEPMAGCFDGITLVPQWSTGVPRSPLALRLTNVDNDPGLELVSATAQGRVMAQDAETGWLKWQSPPPETWINEFTHLAIADTDADGDTEVVTGFSGYYSDESRVYTFDGPAGSPIAGPLEMEITALEYGSDDSVTTNRILVGLANGEVRTLNPFDGSLSAPLMTFPGSVLAIAEVDLTRDGIPDYAAALEDGRVHVYDGALDDLLWTSPYLAFEEGYVWLRGGDFDGNSIP